MIEPERLKAIALEILSVSKADETEVLAFSAQESLTRFANSAIHQNMTHYDCTLYVRAVVGKRSAVASSNLLKKADLRRLVSLALELAKLREEDVHFPGLPSPTPVEPLSLRDERTARFSPADRARLVKSCIRRAERSRSSAAGALSTNAVDMIVASSVGPRVSMSNPVMSLFRSTDASFNVVMTSDDGSGYARADARSVEELDVRTVAGEALRKSLDSRGPIEVPPGLYTVVLEPLATSTLLQFLSYMGFGARSFQENRSFMCGKIGQKITGDNITIYDDGLDAQGLPLPFDFEGVAKKKVTLIEGGFARAVVHDSYTAGKAGLSSTGHALPAYLNAGPQALNLFMEGGSSDLPEMVASVERGLLITRFHYTNIVEPLGTIITGMTRDGTFLIEGGKVTRPVKNLRFTESILEAFTRATALTSARKRYVEDGLTTVVPGAKILDFRFTGITR